MAIVARDLLERNMLMYHPPTKKTAVVLPQNWGCHPPHQSYNFPAPCIGVPRYIKQILTGMKGKIDSNIK